MKPVIFSHLAEQELTEAAVFYESRLAGLGGTFLLAAEAAVRHVRRYPRAWPTVQPGVRRRKVPRFPYGLLYREYADHIAILAVMHLHRHPDRWVDRE